jgi:hypothetical protein
MDGFDDEDEIPAGMRREIERLKTPPATNEITPVLSPGQTERPIDLLGKTVLHSPSGVVGSVRRIYGPGEYLVKPKGVETSGRPVSESVVELEDGNAFLFRPGAFTVLEAPELRLWKLAGLAVREAAEKIVGAGAVFRVTPETTNSILKAALSAQLRTLSLD